MNPLNIAHRGGAGLRPENTLNAFAHAIALGAGGAELDVQLSRDGHVVVFHDYRLKPDICRDERGVWLEKPTPRVSDLSLGGLRTHDVGRARPGGDYARAHSDLVAADGERIPTLAEVIALAKTAPKPFTLFVELKTAFHDRALSASPEALAQATVAVLREADYLGRAVLIGFDWAGLVHARKIEPAVEAWFTTFPRSWFAPGTPPPEHDPPQPIALELLRHAAAAGISPWAAGFDAVKHGGSILSAIKAAGGQGWFPFRADATKETIAQAHAMGLKAGAWTVDDPEEMRGLAAAGIDAICTDRPDKLAAVLG